MTRDERAIEYVLGTLTHAERRAVERARADDPALDGLIATLEVRLAPLLDGLPPEAPPPAVWDRIEAALDREEGPGLPPAYMVAPARAGGFWRGAALTSWALIALAAGVLGWSRLGPDGDDRFVAVVNRDGVQPALIVRVDTRAGTVSVRPVAAEAPAGHSLELWYVEAPAAPRSLGLIREGARPLPESGISGRGVLAVSVEPAGGSPTGQPTGPVIYTGQLIREP